MTEDTMTNWYLLGIGSEVDIHTIHYHAESFLFKVSIRKVLGETEGTVRAFLRGRGLAVDKAKRDSLVTRTEWLPFSWCVS